MLDFSGEAFKKSKALVLFSSTGCKSCGLIKESVERICNKLDGNINLYSCNIDENMDVARRFGVMTVPTILYMERGKPMELASGVGSTRKVEDFIRRIIGG